MGDFAYVPLLRCTARQGRLLRGAGIRERSAGLLSPEAKELSVCSWPVAGVVFAAENDRLPVEPDARLLRLSDCRVITRAKRLRMHCCILDVAERSTHPVESELFSLRLAQICSNARAAAAEFRESSFRPIARGRWATRLCTSFSRSRRTGPPRLGWNVPARAALHNRFRKRSSL